MRPEALDALRAEVQRRDGNKAAAAQHFGISRAAVSMLLADKYPVAKASRIEERILRRASEVECPHLAEAVMREHCERTALGPCPTTTPEAYRAWCACQGCPHRPPSPSATTPPAPRRRKTQGASA